MIKKILLFYFLVLNNILKTNTDFKKQQHHF